MGLQLHEMYIFWLKTKHLLDLIWWWWCPKSKLQDCILSSFIPVLGRPSHPLIHREGENASSNCKLSPPFSQQSHPSLPWLQPPQTPNLLPQMPLSLSPPNSSQAIVVPLTLTKIIIAIVFLLHCWRHCCFGCSSLCKRRPFRRRGLGALGVGGGFRD